MQNRVMSPIRRKIRYAHADIPNMQMESTTASFFFKYSISHMMKDTIAKESDGKGMQEDVTPESHGFTQKKTEVGASVHSRQSVAGVYLAPGLTQIRLGKVLRKTRLQTKRKRARTTARSGLNASTSTNCCMEISNSAPLTMLRGSYHAQHLRNTHATRVLRDHATLYFTVLCACGM